MVTATAVWAREIMKTRILIIDDDAYIRRVIEFAFQQEAYEVFSASDGEEGLRKAKELQPDIIILDILMPKMDGYEVCRSLKVDPFLAPVPVVMLSALGNTEVSSSKKDTGLFFQSLDNKLRGLDSGAVEFISKPIAIKKLVERIDYWVSMIGQKKVQG
jgi:DNA-binding response OmpR family regulator